MNISIPQSPTSRRPIPAVKWRNSPEFKQKAARDAGRVVKANRTGRVFIRILGSLVKLTPGNRPITVSGTYDLATQQPADVAVKLAHRHGTIARPEHFVTIAEYDVDDRVKASHQFSRVVVLQCDHPHEKATRERLGITDRMLDPFEEHKSWYLTKVSTKIT